METTKSGNDMAVYSMKLAAYLLDQGYRLNGTASNHKHEHLTVFFFGNTPELRRVMNEWIEKNKKR